MIKWILKKLREDINFYRTEINAARYTAGRLENIRAYQLAAEQLDLIDIAQARMKRRITLHDWIAVKFDCLGMK